MFYNCNLIVYSMALWGKGDPRWIVEERPDSTNVNNWHWTERDATIWSKEKLKTLFLSLHEETDEGSWKMDEVKTMEGEATLSNRKGKIIIFYEWDIKLTYKGKVTGSDLDHSGTITIPNLSDENFADDVDVEIRGKGDSKNSETLKKIVRKNAIKMCRDLCQQYVNDLKTEYATGMVLPTKGGVNGNPNTVKKNNENAKKFNESMNNLKVDNLKTEKKKTTSYLSLSLTEEFKTTADEMYITLTLAERLSMFTRSQCRSDVNVGGQFSIMNDNITGSYVELVPSSKIVEKWRFKDWPADTFSTVTIELQQKSDCTVLKLSQTGVPDYDKVRTEEGWKQYFWGPIKQLFGYGAQLF